MDTRNHIDSAFISERVTPAGGGCYGPWNPPPEDSKCHPFTS